MGREKLGIAISQDFITTLTSQHFNESVIAMHNSSCDILHEEVDSGDPFNQVDKEVSRADAFHKEG